MARSLRRLSRQMPEYARPAADLHPDPVAAQAQTTQTPGVVCCQRPWSVLSKRRVASSLSLSPQIPVHSYSCKLQPTRVASQSDPGRRVFSLGREGNRREISSLDSVQSTPVVIYCATRFCKTLSSLWRNGRWPKFNCIRPSPGTRSGPITSVLPLIQEQPRGLNNSVALPAVPAALTLSIVR